MHLLQQIMQTKKANCIRGERRCKITIPLSSNAYESAGPDEPAARSGRRGQASPRQGAVGVATTSSRPTASKSTLPFSPLTRTTTRRSRGREGAGEAGSSSSPSDSGDREPPSPSLPPLRRISGAAKRGGRSHCLSPSSSSSSPLRPKITVAGAREAHAQGLS
ncbi:hypothetical protein PVAP13_3NG082729 [Panicum virgatum]|uniref:Uncharacterized protein n=1 Tax=Panicum virgatum TaxID=38727 RepID=A0A8T0U4N0_PANVG|nr:hypothetical protein PVAP13_3NG082729 [Panicum virgatum]